MYNTRKHQSLVIIDNSSLISIEISRCFLRAPNATIPQFLAMSVTYTYSSRFTASEDCRRLSSFHRSPRPCLWDDPWNSCPCSRANGNSDCCLFASLAPCACDCCRRENNCGTRTTGTNAARNQRLPILRCHSGVAVERSRPRPPDAPAFRVDSHYICNKIRHIEPSSIISQSRALKNAFSPLAEFK